MEMKMKMDTTVPNLRRHLSEIGKAFDIAIVEDRMLQRSQGRSMRFLSESLSDDDRQIGMKERMVHVHPVDDETSYAVAMHEVGHQVAPEGFCRLKRPAVGCHPRCRFEYMAAKLVAEEAAWEWAQYYVEQVFPWTAAMEMVKQFALDTYKQTRRRGIVA